MVFEYPQSPHQRRHGPRGYVGYQAYKPWLRDDFDFRCVYCLWRERWTAAGDASFSVEHVQSQLIAPERTGDYDNLVYACCRCNSIKTDARNILDPCQDALGDHLQVLPDGVIHGLTPEGRDLIRICKLDQPLLTESRGRLLELFRVLERVQSPKATALLRLYRGYPDNLPVLAKCRPPGGNTRPAGIAGSRYEQSRRGELPVTY
jgi:hypothetical protein